MTIQDLESDLARAKTAAQAIVAAVGDNEPNESQRAELARLLAEGKDLRARIDRMHGDADFTRQIEAFTGGRGNRASSPNGGVQGMSAGALYATATAEFFKRGGHRVSGGWRSDSVEVPYSALFATTLTESPTSGGKLVVPDYQPGIVPSATRPIVVMDLLMPGTTNSNTVVYMVETQFTNAAAPVAEGTAKPESALVFDQVSEPVLKVAHWLPVTEELFEDVAAIQTYIDGRLTLGVQLAEADQLLNGNGTLPNYRGLMLRATAPTIVQGAGETIADAIAKQIAQIATTAMVPATGIVMNPSDWLGVLLSKTSTGDYYANGPFGPVSAPSLWGLPVALTSAIVAKTVLVGAFATQAQFFRRGGIRVEASNSHQDFFVKNLVAIRAEERGALACYRPGAFGKVTLL